MKPTYEFDDVEYDRSGKAIFQAERNTQIEITFDGIGQPEFIYIGDLEIEVLNESAYVLGVQIEDTFYNLYALVELAERDYEDIYLEELHDVQDEAASQRDLSSPYYSGRI